MKKHICFPYTVLNLLLFCFFCLQLGCGSDDRPKVVPAKGRLSLEKNGKLLPIAKAKIVLHPANDADAFPAFPAATTNEKGFFVLGTYTIDDGAPEGEYIVTIDWRPRQKPKKDILGQGEIPTGPDRLRGVYADRNTSKLRVTITAGKELNIIVPAP